MKSKGIFTRILSAILCAIMIIGMVPVAIAAEGEALALEVGTVELALDDSAVDGYYTVNVPINVTVNPGFNALRFTVTYNEALELIGWTNGTVMSDTHNHTPSVENAESLSPFMVTYGNISGAQDSVQNSTATGELIVLQFKVADTVAVGTNLPVSIVEVIDAMAQGDALDPDPITTSVTAGGVTTKAAKKQPIVYSGNDLWVGIADPTGIGLLNKWTSAYDIVRDLWVVNFTEAINKTGSEDGDRVYVKFPAVPADAGLPYVVVGIQVPTTTASWDFNVYYGTDRTWNAKDQGSAIGKTEIGKQIYYLANDTTNYGNKSVAGIASNAWAQGAFSAPAGEGAYVQYVAFFETLDEAKAFKYVSPTYTVEDILSDGDDSTELDFVYLDAEAVKVATGGTKGDIVTEDGRTYVHYTANEAAMNASLDIKANLTGLVTSTGVNSFNDFKHHAMTYRASGTGKGDFLNIRGDGEQNQYTDIWEQQWYEGFKIPSNSSFGLFKYSPYDFKGCATTPPISNVWTNAYLQIQEFAKGAAEDAGYIDIENYMLARTTEQIYAFTVLSARKELHVNSAAIAFEDGTSDLLVGATKSYTYELTGRNDVLPVISDATVESVVYSVDNENATITADGRLTGVAAGTANVTATFTLTSGDKFTATTAVEIKHNPTPDALYKGSDLTLAGSGSGLLNKVVYVYDKATGFVTATLPEFTGADENRFHINFDGVSREYPYVAYGVRISNSPKQSDNTNPRVTIDGTNRRLWGSSADAAGFGSTQVYSATEIKKHVMDITTFGAGDEIGKDEAGNKIYAKWSMVTETDVINGIVINAWNGKGTIPAGTVIDVEYVAFFDNLEDAKNYVYIAPTPRTITFKVNGNVYATQTVVEGATFDYPEIAPTIPGKAFVKWDVEESVVTGDLTVNAVFAEPVLFFSMQNGMTVMGNGDVNVKAVNATENEAPYYRFTANTSGTRDDGDYGALYFDTSDTDYTKDNVFVIRYRTNLASNNFDLAPYFYANRIYGCYNPGMNNDGQWHTVVYDFATNNFTGGNFDTNTWDYANEKSLWTGVQIRPFYNNTHLTTVGGYVDIQYVALFDSVEAANAFVYAEPEMHEIVYKANGNVVATEYALEGTGLVHTDTVPEAPEGYYFKDWDIAKDTIVTGDMTVNAIFFKIGSAVADKIAYGKDMTLYLGKSNTANGSLWDMNVDIQEDAFIVKADAQKGGDWGNDGCAKILVSGFDIPTEYKYYVIASSFAVSSNKISHISSADNLVFYVNGTAQTALTFDYTNKADAIYATVVDASSVLGSEANANKNVNKILFNPIKQDGDSRPGSAGKFTLEFIAAFETEDDANTFAAEYAASKEKYDIDVTITGDGSVNGNTETFTTSYQKNAIASLTAVPEEGWVFDGWYLNGTNEAASTATTYTFTLNAETSVEARFTEAINKTVAKLEIENGADDSLGSITVSGAIVGDNYVASGTAVQITATPKEEVGVFGYWQRTVSTSGISVYLGIDESLDAYALGTDVFYQPVFYPAGTKDVVLHVDATNVIIKPDPETGAITEPTKPGYTFKEWKVREANGVITVKEPVYVKNNSTTSTLTVYAANGVATSYAPSFNEVVTLDAGANNVVWTLKIGNKTYPVSYNREYSFRYRITAPSATLTATVTSDAPKALVNSIEAVYADAATRFIGSYYVPESYTVTGYGMLLTSDKAVAEDMILETKGIIVGNIATATNEDSMMFVVNKNNTLKNGERTTWYGRAFLMYTDGTDSHVIYGDTISK